MFRGSGERTRNASNESRIRASHARKNHITYFRDRPMVSRGDKVEIENSGAEVSEEAVEVEATRPFVRNFPNQVCAGARIFRRCEQNALAGQTECKRRIPMSRRGVTLVSVLVLVGAALIPSCAKPYHEENERYVFVATNINLPYWQEVQAGFLDAAKA